MPNTETVRALVSAFNIHNYARNTVKTNFTLQSRGGGDCIVVSFDKGMKGYQCEKYLDSIKGKIIREFYGIEESNDAEILDTAKLIFDVNSFPFENYEDVKSFSFKNYKGDWLVDKQGRIEFVTPVDQGVIFNLKSHLASSLEKDVLEDMRVSSTTVPFNKGKYLCHSKFPDKESRKQFEREFLSRMENRYGYRSVFKKPLKVEGNSVYIRDVFDDARFIDSVTRYKAWLVGMYLGVDSSANHKVKLFKDMIVESIGQLTGVTIYGFVCASPLDREEASVLISLVLDSGRRRVLTNEEALKLNYAFNYAVFNDLYGRIQGELLIDRRNGIYGIDFSDKEISHCVITKIIESSVINKDHELSIDPELHFRALSPAQSPFNSPTHAGPSGLRTPPRQRQEDRDSGYDSNSPPKPKDSGSSHGVPGPLTELSDMEWKSTTQSQDGALEGSPRQGSEKSLLHNPVNLAGTSGELPPRSHLSYTTVSYDVSGPSSSSQSVGAVQNRWLPQGTSENKRIPSMQLTKPGPSGLSWSQSRPSSWKGANESGSAWTSTLGSYSSPPPLIPSSDSSVPGSRLPVARSSSSKGASERRTSDKPLTEEEEKLFKALLYAFNLNNYIQEYPHTNFIVENGKIASSINDGVDVKEYLKELRNSMIEEYYRTEEKAKEACDLNEFPFKFLSNCEKNQEITVVANISSGALSNLKKLFIREHERKVEIEDININIVEEAVKSKKNIWVNSQIRRRGEKGGYYEKVRPYEAITTCYPDESNLEYIPIIKDKGGYCLDRKYSSEEVESFIKQWRRPKGKSVAGKGKPEDNKDSGYSSGFVTDAEKVSSNDEPMDYQASSHVQQQNPWSDNEGNSRESSRSGNSNSSSKRALELSVENLRISTKLDATKTEQQCSPAKKSRRNWSNPPL
ncbi:hypothetical protein [Wolbachia endosymbiont (group A) of Conops quadrifasciatus]|uniref:hypothetical protein n=1 Tax=Wolbachia endosymbiont (group A) of Conops quadrifasciatus TaxID=3066143 RepID=UPI003132E1E5